MHRKKSKGETLTGLQMFIGISWCLMVLFCCVASIVGETSPIPNGLYDNEHVLEDEKPMSGKSKEKSQQKAKKQEKKATAWIDLNDLFISPGEVAIEDFNDYHGGP